MRLLLFSIIASCSAGGLLFAQATTETQSPASLEIRLPAEFLQKPSVPYDPTNGTVAFGELACPYTDLFKVLRDSNRRLYPTQIVFEVTQGPDHPEITSSPRTWKYTIDDETAIRNIVHALLHAKGRKPLCSWGPVVKHSLPFIYKLTLNYGAMQGHSAGAPLNSVTLDLSSAWQNVHNYDPLEQVLAAYPPGFKAQWILHTDP